MKRGSLAEFLQFADPRFFRCHAAYEGSPRVIYVLRDPGAYQDAFLLALQAIPEQGFLLSLGQYLQSDDHWPCQWDEHVASWLMPRAIRRCWW